MDAYLAGLEDAQDAGIDLSTIHSVASFFVSRVDTEVDKRLDAIGTDEAEALKGKAAVANARLAYAAFEEVFGTDRFAGLEDAGAHAAAAAVGLDRRQGPSATPTRCTSPTSSSPAPSTRCPRRPWRRSPTTARSRATP